MSQVTPVLEAPRRAVPWKAVPAPLATAAAVTALAHLPLLLAQGRQLWLRPHYQLFPLVLAGAVVLAAPAWRLVAAANGDADIARSSLSKALALDPHFDNADDARRALAQLR